MKVLSAMDVAISWSGGKDSCFACYKAILEGFHVSYLMTFISPRKKSMSHGVDSKLLFFQAEAIGIPMVQKIVTWETYEQGFKEAIDKLRQKGIKGIVFGDLANIPRHEGWIDRVCSELHIDPIKPLWGSDPKQLLTDFVKKGFKAFIIRAKADFFNKEWLGRHINELFISDILNHKEKKNIDLCGELGEYHTFVFDGPIFKKQIEILDFRMILLEGYWSLDIKEYKSAEK